MKKLLLLMAAGLVAAGANAQTSPGSVVRVGGIDQAKQVTLKESHKPLPLTQRHVGYTANKTTLGGSRWYNYVEHLILLNSATDQNGYEPYLWFRPDMYGIYGDGAGGTVLDTIEFASYAMTFDPIDELGTAAHDFNDIGGYNGEIGVTSTNAYKLDSVAIWGNYGRNDAKPTIVDTLRVSFVYGNGSGTNMPIYYFDGMAANFPPYDTVRFAAIWHNEAKGTALKNPSATAAPAVLVKDILLHPADTGFNGFLVGLSSGEMNIPANNLVGVAVSFISGEAYAPFSDTAFTDNATNPYKFGMFRPLIFEENDGAYPTYFPKNWNMGHVKFLPESASWDSLYVPAVAYTAPLAYEFPYIDFKISCPTCGIINGIHDINIGSVSDAHPNPANTEVSISFTMKQSANVNINLTNAVGQLVKTQNLGKYNANQAGKAVINVSDLSSGVYFYTVEANGQRVTKRLVVSH